MWLSELDCFCLLFFSEQIWSYLNANTLLHIVSTYRQAKMCACVSVCVFASTRVISLGQVSVCLPVSLLWSQCLPKECTTSDLSLTLIVQLIQLVPWGWAVLCPGKWEICAFLPFFLLLLDENDLTKSIKNGKCIRSENERSLDLRRKKWNVKLLNVMINVTKCQIICKSFVEGQSFSPYVAIWKALDWTWLSWDREIHKSSLFNHTSCKWKWKK